MKGNYVVIRCRFSSLHDDIFFSVPLTMKWKAEGDDGMWGWRVPYAFLPFQTPLCPCAMERERRGRRENGETREEGTEERVWGWENAAREQWHMTPRTGIRRGKWWRIAPVHVKRDKDLAHRNMKGNHQTDGRVCFFLELRVGVLMLNCPLVPGGTRPSRSRPSCPALPCSTAGSRSRRCRPLPAQCGTAGSGRSDPCSSETLQEIREPEKFE